MTRSTSANSTTSCSELLDVARRVLSVESEAVALAARRLDDSMIQAVTLIEQHVAAPARGRLIVTGMGKSGLIATKVAATLTSTGTPAIFLHPSEGMHGDLGAVIDGDVVLALSNSGETRELLDILPYLQHEHAVPLIGILGRPQSTLGRACKAVLDASCPGEATESAPAPTVSTTVQLALGDALAITLAERRGFDARQYARLHPGGAIGRRLTLRVSDLMHGGENLAAVGPTATMRDAIAELATKSLGAVCVVDCEQNLLGVLTDGDLKRQLLDYDDLLVRRAADMATPHPTTAHPRQMAVEALATMENRPSQISVLPVVDDNRLVGLLRLHDIVQAGVTLQPGQEANE